MRIAVIGAGPAGMTAAYVLSKAAMAVDVYEASDAVGGLARSLDLWGQKVDLGPHRFFSKDRRVNEFWLEVVGRDYVMVDRRTRILYKDRFFHYPLEPWDALVKLGPVEATRCAFSFARACLSPEQSIDNFGAWVTSRFGRRLFEIFFRPYSEKLWGIPCEELDADFAAQRIKQFSLKAALQAYLSLDARKRHATLVDRFAYPLQGTGMVYSRMHSAVQGWGGRVQLNTPVTGVATESEKVTGIILPDGTVREYENVISTMPLTILVSQLPHVPGHIRDHASQLTFRNTIIVYLHIDSASVCDDQWIYVQDPDFQTGRITNFRNWNSSTDAAYATTVLAMEFWCNRDDSLWQQTDERMINLATRELIATGLVQEQSLVTDGMVYRIPRCYPVYRRGYQEHLRPIQEYLKSIDGLHVIGRYGAFKYNNQDHSILMGLLAAENIMESADHDLWSVNSDYESYQEDYIIGDAGLIPASK